MRRRQLCGVLAALLFPAVADAQPANFAGAPATPVPILATAEMSSGASGAVGLGQMLHVSSATASPKAVAAPACGTTSDGQFIAVADTAATAGTYPITVTPAAGTTISGQSSTTLPQSKEAVLWRCDGPARDWVALSASVAITAGASAAYTGTGSQNIVALESDWTAVAPTAGITFLLPASPIDHDCRVAVNNSRQHTYPMNVSGNGKYIGPASDTTISSYVPGPMKVCYSSATGYWSQSS